MIDLAKRHPGYATVLGVIVLYSLLGFFLAPYLVEKTLVETLERDFDAELRVEKIEINPFVLSLRIRGLALDNPGGEPTVRVAEAFANFQLSSIFRRALTFDEIRISSPELFIARDASGNLDIAYLANPAGDATAGTPPAGEADPVPPQLLVFDFRIEDGFVHWSDQIPGETVATRLGPISVEIAELNTLPDRSGQQTVVIATENTGTLRWTGALQLNPVSISGHARLEGFHFPLVSAYIRHPAGVEIVDGSSDVELDYEIHATDSGQIAARIDNFDLTLANIVIDSFADGSGFDFAGEDRQFLTLPGVRLADGRFQWPERMASLGSISIDRPRLETYRDESGVFSLEPRRAETAGEPASPATGADDSVNSPSPWQVSIGSMTVDDLALDLEDRSVTPVAKLGVSNFDLRIDEISNEPGKRFPITLSLRATTGGRLALQGDVAILPMPTFDLAVDAKVVELAGAQPYVGQLANLSLKSGTVNLDGRIEGSAEETFSFRGDVEIAGLDVAESIDNARLVSWKNLGARKVALSLARRRLDVSRVRVDELYADIQINQEGSLNLGRILKDGAAPAPAGSTSADDGGETEATNAAFEIRIGDIVVADAAADFADRSLPLPFAVKISSLNGEMTTISTASDEPSEVTLEGKVDEYGLARVNGTITPLRPADNTDLLVSFENIQVPKFTPYSIPFAGREIASGTLDLKLGYQVKDSRLVGENSIRLSNFELGRKVPHPGALDLPLGLAVALLKDASGKIDIELPVRGNVGDPQFSFAEVIRGALGNLITRIALSPFSALASLLGIEANELAQVRFPAGRSDLTPPEKETAARLAEALALRPKLRLVVSGVYAPEADGQALLAARFDAGLEQRIAGLEADSEPSMQYPDLRRTALERMYSEQLAAGAVTRTLDDWRLQFTAPAENQAEAAPRLDRLAYANALRKQLIALLVIDDNALASLASARAEALQTALLTIDENLRERIAIAESVEVKSENGENVEMKLKLTAGQVDRQNASE